MGRPKRNCIYEFYTYDEVLKSSTCTLCKTVLRGKHGANLVRHFSHKHKTEHEEVQARNKERKLLDLKDLKSLDTTKKDTMKQVEAVEGSLLDDPTAEFLTVDSDDSVDNGNIEEDEVEASCVAPAPAPDPLYEAQISDHSTDSSDSDEYTSPIKSEVLKRSSVRERRHSDVVRKNIAIAEYYEAKKKKVYLEIKKLKMELNLRERTMRSRSNAHAEANVKMENL